MKKQLFLLALMICFGAIVSGCSSTTSKLQKQFIQEAAYFVTNDGQMLVQYLQNDQSKKQRQKQPVRSRLNSLTILINKINQQKSQMK